MDACLEQEPKLDLNPEFPWDIEEKKISSNDQFQLEARFFKNMGEIQIEVSI